MSTSLPTASRFFRGLFIGVLIALPFWALVAYGVSSVAGIE